MEVRNLVSQIESRGISICLNAAGELQLSAKDQPDPETLSLIATIKERKTEVKAFMTAPPRAWIIEEVRTGDEIVAVKICSAFLQDHLWVISSDAFTPNDGLPYYTAAEVELLKDASPQTVQWIHDLRKVFPEGCRVINSDEAQ
jgi:hypothetical protein